MVRDKEARLRLVFVCGGNTCRGPMAAGIAKKILGELGTYALTYSRCTD